ncbi:MAG: tRNA (adenosine(37)-N6)-dimethylallyltransferase MiaA [Sulfurifustaceae bacterium]
MSDTLPFVICLMGPTGAGKTALALALHEQFPVEIVSVDSSQVYRGMDIGTAKPSAEELARAPHRLIDIRDPVQAYSAAEFCADAEREMSSIIARGRIPLLVGGTMFYFHALEHGLSELPSADVEVRRQLTEEARRTGWAALHARLAMIDADAARRINPNDAQRIQRALEIHTLTGQAPGALARASIRAPASYRFYKIALWPGDRAVLHARIERRFEQMLKRGFIDEVDALRRRGDLNQNLPSMRTVGYRQVWSYLTEKINYNQMVARAVAATRQLAKRQLTWLRRDPTVQRVECSGELPLTQVTEIVQRMTMDNGSHV